MSGIVSTSGEWDMAAFSSRGTEGGFPRSQGLPSLPDRGRRREDPQGGLGGENRPRPAALQGGRLRVREAAIDGLAQRQGRRESGFVLGRGRECLEGGAEVESVDLK